MYRYLFRRKMFVVSLGSLHLTLMAALGIWLWSSPYQYERRQGERLIKSLSTPHDLLPLFCTSTALFGADVSLTSAALRQVSLVIYSFFLAPVLNLVIPVVFFLFLFINCGGVTPFSDDALDDFRMIVDSLQQTKTTDYGASTIVSSPSVISSGSTSISTASLMPITKKRAS
jgi:hypothetical protein